MLRWWFTHAHYHAAVAHRTCEQNTSAAGLQQPHASICESMLSHLKFTLKNICGMHGAHFGDLWHAWNILAALLGHSAGSYCETLSRVRYRVQYRGCLYGAAGCGALQASSVPGHGVRSSLEAEQHALKQ
jgi:hypothetical protein